MSLKPELETAFETGAHWAINEFLKDLWHPASKEPDKNRICLVRVVYHLNNGMLPDEECGYRNKRSDECEIITHQDRKI